MLRALVAVLLLANLGFWAWSAGALDGLGLGPRRERDPARLTQQLRADSIRVLTPDAAAALMPSRPTPQSVVPEPAAAGATASACLEAGPFSATAADDAERILAAAGLAPGSWQRLRLDFAAQYGVVLGPFNSRESLQSKREELARLRLSGEEIALAPEGAPAAAQRPGLVLGRHDSRPAAEAALATFNQRGVRTARVALLRAGGTETRLRFDPAGPALAEQLRGLSGAALGAGFAACEGAR